MNISHALTMLASEKKFALGKACNTNSGDYICLDKEGVVRGCTLENNGVLILCVSQSCLNRWMTIHIAFYNHRPWHGSMLIGQTVMLKSDNVLKLTLMLMSVEKVKLKTARSTIFIVSFLPKHTAHIVRLYITVHNYCAINLQWLDRTLSLKIK